MKIAVIDDERPSRSELIHQILEVYPYSEIEEADSGGAAIELISNQTFDILFIDINLNDMEGTALAAAAKKLLPDAKLIFATAYPQYAVKAFELEVDNYILKPFVPERVRMVLEKCKKEQEQVPIRKKTCGKLAINCNRKILFLNIGQIVYLETEGRACRIHTTDGDYLDSQLLGEMEKQLLPYGFFRIHKSYLVHVKYISELFPWAQNSLAVKMQGFEKAVLPVGREKVKQLRQLLGL